MSRALELAEKCDMVIEDRLVLYLSQDGMSDGPIFFSQLERFYVLAKADALREAAAECVDIIDRTLLRNKAGELEKK